MFKVLIGLKEVADADTLAEAARIFVRKTQELVRSGQCSSFALFETCMIETKAYGALCMMNFDAIRGFVNAAGIVENGVLTDKPLPFISRELERRIFTSAFSASFVAYIKEGLVMAVDVLTGDAEEREQHQNTIVEA